MTPAHRLTDTEALEARLAMRMTAALAVRSESTQHDVTERLRVARSQALERARAKRRATQPQRAEAKAPLIVGVSPSGVALLGTTTPWWQRAAALLPIAMLVLGLAFIDRQVQLDQVHAAAEVDAQLLVDDLPPNAYSDPGFAEFLRTPAP